MKDWQFVANFIGAVCGMILVIIGIFAIAQPMEKHGLTTTTGVYMRCTPEEDKLICTW